ncbi:MAG TPA: S1C family serine protease, partial [Puia sp.]|nr:S1C family serine protease [Puia sp.]
MQDTTLLDAVERYVRGEMTPGERELFEHVRTTNPEVDQLVVEHSRFLDRLTEYGQTQHLKAQIQQAHRQLENEGHIEQPRRAIVVALWNRYKRVVFVAACIAGITALGISGLVSLLTPKVKPATVEYLIGTIRQQGYQINNLSVKLNSVQQPPTFDRGGTGFLIDGKGYLITNAHVVRNATVVDVQNSIGEYHARIVQLDPKFDLALLKIDDTSYHAFTGLPYGISKTGADLGEDLF